MSVSVIMILSSVSLSMSGVTRKPVVLVLSKWEKIFTGQSLTLSCNVDTAYRENQVCSWYKDNRKTDREGWIFTIQSAGSEDSGDYTCEISDGDRSDPLALRVSDGHVLLQTSPYPVYEGDTLTLTCHQRDGSSTNSIFYKGSHVLESHYRDDLYFTNVDKNATATYTCRKVIALPHGGNFMDEDSADITVRELFSDPEMIVTPYPLTVGAAMTVTCDTRLAPPKAHTELQFAFYVNGQKVQEFGQSNQYLVNVVQWRNSGDYTCDVRTESNSVKKTSRVINLVIEGSTIKPSVFFLSKWGKIFSGESVTLTCNVDFLYNGFWTYSWYRNNRTMDVKNGSFTIQSAGPEDSGDYACALSDSDRSDPVVVNVWYGNVLLQASPSVYEGDTLTLTCHHRRGYSVKSTTFYKGSKMMESNLKDYVNQENVGKTATDTYKCIKVLTLTDEGNFTDEDSADIVVRELFSDPEIKVTPYPLTAGDAATLTCETLLAPSKAHTKLQFAFYRNGQKVSEFGQSSQYRILIFQLQDSGNYTCDVKSDSVKKMSRGINLQIGGTKPNDAESRANYTRLNIVRMALSACILVVAVCVVYHEMNNEVLKPESLES